jgi:hypothetical protein
MAVFNLPHYHFGLFFKAILQEIHAEFEKYIFGFLDHHRTFFFGMTE